MFHSDRWLIFKLEEFIIIVVIVISDIPPLTQEELVNLIGITVQLSGMDSLIHTLHQQASMDPSSLMKHGRTKGIKSKSSTLTFVQITTNSELKYFDRFLLFNKICGIYVDIFR